MHEFFEGLRVQRWDDHRYYHHSRINQSLHLVSALSFLSAYVMVFKDPAIAALIGWLVAIALYISWTLREWRTAVGAVLAVLHYIILSVGVYAVFHIEVTPATVEMVHRGIPGSEWVLFEESAHVPHLEETDRFLQVHVGRRDVDAALLRRHENVLHRVGQVDRGVDVDDPRRPLD